MNPNEEVQEKPATPQTEESAIIPIAEIASEEQWNRQIAILNRRSTDLVNSGRGGYGLHGPRSSFEHGLRHLNKMTPPACARSSRSTTRERLASRCSKPR